MLRTGRDATIFRLASDKDVVDGLAEMFGLSRRTSFRVLRAHRRGTSRWLTPPISGTSVLGRYKYFP
jgi:hypothetical protein